MPRVLRNGQIIDVQTGRYKGVWRVFSSKASLTVDLGSPDKVRLESKGEGQKREVQIKTLIKDGMVLKKNPLTGKQHPNPAEWEVTKEFRKWVTGFPLERVDYLDLSLEIQGVIEGVVRGFRKAVMENKPRHYKPWTPKNTKWVG